MSGPSEPRAIAEFGYSRWGSDLVRLAEPLSAKAPEPQLPRARSIARNGGVTLTIDGREVTAHVHRGGTASVAHIEFAPMPTATAQALRDAFSGSRSHSVDDALHRRVLDNGQSPAPIIDHCDCSCTARSKMCVHVLAAVYALAAAVDADPRLAFGLQDFDPRPNDHSGDDGTGTKSGEAAMPTTRWLPFAGLDARGYYG